MASMVSAIYWASLDYGDWLTQTTKTLHAPTRGTSPNRKQGYPKSICTQARVKLANERSLPTWQRGFRIKRVRNKLMTDKICARSIARGPVCIGAHRTRSVYFGGARISDHFAASLNWRTICAIAYICKPSQRRPSIKGKYGSRGNRCQSWFFGRIISPKHVRSLVSRTFMACPALVMLSWTRML